MTCGDPTNPGGQGLKSNGDPCNLPVMAGRFRCHMHGGMNATAKIKAEQAMALLRMPAIEVMYHAMLALDQTVEQLTATICAACGYPVGDLETKEALIKACVGAAKTCQSVLDRTGIGPKSTLEIKQADGDIDPKLLTTDEKSRMIALLTELRALKTEIRTRLSVPNVGVKTLPSHNTPEQIM